MRSLPLMNLQNMLKFLGDCLCHAQDQAGEMTPGSLRLSCEENWPGQFSRPGFGFLVHSLLGSFELSRV